MTLAHPYNLRSQHSPIPQLQLPIRQRVLQQPNSIIITTTMTDLTTRAFDSIKSFHGTSQDNSCDWCDRAEIVFTAFNINDADRLSRVGMKLEDDAFNWYRDNQGPYLTWAAFRQAFQQAFPPPDRTQNRHLLAEQINQRKQGMDESIHDYYYALDKLCREYDPHMSAIDKTIKLVSGLREHLKEKMLPLNIQTPEQFMIQAKNFESSEKVMAHYRQRNGSIELPEPSFVYDKYVESAVATSQPYRRQLQYQQPRQYRNLSENQQTMKSSVARHDDSEPIRIQQQRTTIRVPEYSQNASSFHSRQQTITNSRRMTDNRQCFNCGQRGHIQRNCPHHLKD